MTLTAIKNALLPLNGAYFITGTDTEIGKTTTTTQLVKALAKQGKTVYAIKPVTAGMEIDESGDKYSDDAKRINEFATVKPPMSAIAPIQLATPCSPHIAARIDDVTLDKDKIVNIIRQTLTQYSADVVLIEGAGGWFTPINEHETLADVAIALNSPVIVVVGIKLGSLNHALLTLDAIWQAGLTVAMVVFNECQLNTPFFHEQIAWLKDKIALEAQSLDRQVPAFFIQPFYSASYKCN